MASGLDRHDERWPSWCLQGSCSESPPLKRQPNTPIEMKVIMNLLAAALCSLPFTTQGVTISLGTVPGRVATLSDATTGATGLGNGTDAAVNANPTFSPLPDFTERAERTSAGTTGIFSVAVTSGSFGSSPVAGTWTINDPNFWTTYGFGVISMHVGNGGGNPDHFIWLLEPNKLSGTWSYTAGNTNGGGLSNLKLMSSGQGTTRVPDAGSTLLLLGFALSGIGAARRALSV